MEASTAKHLWKNIIADLTPAVELTSSALRETEVDLSVIIVNYNVKYFLEQALFSLRKASQGLKVEYIVIDNASSDNSAEYIESNFPWVNLIANRENVGFARANNQGLNIARGKYLLVINPDTVVGEDTLKTLINYMDSHPEIGAVGPKLIDKEGRFELGSRRGFPTPFTAFSKITGLASLFPQSRLFAKYNLTYLDPDTACEIDSLSGCFMLVRKEIFEKIGGFDEGFFLYGEDLDWCYRIKKAGWKIYYLPQVEVIHYKGESTLRSNIDARRTFFDAMHRFVKKHYSGKFPITASFIRLGIFINYIFDWFKRSLHLLKAPLADLLFLNSGLIIGRIIHFNAIYLPKKIILPYIIYNLGWLAISSVFGVYGRKKVSILNTIFAVCAGLAFIFSFTYFFKQFAFSRFVLLFTGLTTLIAIPGWRWLAWKLPGSAGFREWFKRRTLLVGVDELTERIAAKTTENEAYPFKIIGFIDCGHRYLGKKTAGVKVVGSIEDLNNLIHKLSIEEVVFSGKSLSYGEIVKHISLLDGKVGFKVLPETALDSTDGEMPFLELGFKSKPNLLSRLKTKG